MSPIPVAADIVRGVPTSLLIGGRWRPADSGWTLGVEDPATGEMIAEVADAWEDEAGRAMGAAQKAQADWARTPPRKRGDILMEVWRRMLGELDRLAALMTLEMGKSLAESRGEVAYAAEFLRWFAEESVRIDGRYATAPDGSNRL